MDGVAGSGIGVGGLAGEQKQNFCHPVGLYHRLTNALEPAFLEYANGARIRERNERMDWPMVFVSSQEFVECRACNTSSPVLPPDSISNQTSAVLFPAGYVARHLIIDKNRPRFIGWVPEDVVPPM